MATIECTPLILPMEEWHPVKGYVGLYQVSSHGRVRSIDRIRYQRQRWSDKLFTRLHRGRLLAATPVHGYPRVVLNRDGHKQAYLVHHLVIYAFIGQGEPGEMCNHKDGNRQNNFTDNLEWVTPSGNVVHALRVLQNGICGAKRFDLRLVCTLRHAGHTVNQIAERIGVSIETIRFACLGKHWSQVENPLMDELPPTPWELQPPKERECAMCHQTFPYEYFAADKGEGIFHSKFCQSCFITNRKTYAREWARKQRQLKPGPGRGAFTGTGKFHPKAVRPDIPAILTLHAQGFTKRAIAEELGIDPTMAWRVIHGTHWSQRQPS